MKHHKNTVNPNFACCYNFHPKQALERQNFNRKTGTRKAFLVD